MRLSVRERAGEVPVHAWLQGRTRKGSVILLGELALWVALLMATWSATVSFAGGRIGRADLVASGERALYATFAFVLLSSLGLWSALLSSDFSLRYVASYTSANLPAVYKFS